MSSSQADTLLDEIFRAHPSGDEHPQGAAAAPEQAGKKRERVRLISEEDARRRDRRSDLTIAALGVALGLICALFPWYIFFNPDEFGVRAMRFGIGGAGSGPTVRTTTDRVGKPPAAPVADTEDVDLLSTGTVAPKPDKEEAPGLIEQPFPPPATPFRVVLIANGRAMLEDETGLFVVQPGSILPDNSRVQAIEQRNGMPVLVTDSGQVLEIGR